MRPWTAAWNLPDRWDGDRSPLSNFVVTNLFAGALKLHMRPYLVASFFGMIPSSVMYAAWGKFAKKPHPAFLAVALAAMLLMAFGYLAIQRRRPFIAPSAAPERAD